MKKRARIAEFCSKVDEEVKGGITVGAVVEARLLVIGGV